MLHISAAPRWKVQLLRQWELLRDGTQVPVGTFGRRVIAGVTLAGPASVEAIAELLLPGRPVDESAERLRAEVHALRDRMPGLIDDNLGRLALAPEVWVDLAELLHTAYSQAAIVPAGSELIGELRDAELLPGWVEDWALYYRECVRLFRFATLEAIARYSLRLDDPGTAAAAARSSSALEPLRESSHTLLIRALVLAGHLREAFFVHEDFRHRLLEQTGTEPSPALTYALGLAASTAHTPARSIGAGAAATEAARPDDEAAHPQKEAVENGP
ncbi:AfsR/SARP family transcriptional regulator [Sinomonas susongensis]|uniref:AfsR/SARP family transcriptional regulator n=1 Tax=Sinomonas susongensis TaxID=1324851 RepID=UPI001108043C|nr:BTAD domain-containing putative transcriptional regulator [Sinomonas susongensis]